MDLSAPETRVLGCLLEKQLTTPDMYPLTLNGLRLACNQSTNRDPVVDYDEAALRDALHRLERRGLARMASGRGSRAPKWRHLLAQALPLTPDEHAILCVLLLRGPQTPGELKQRAGRMHVFADLDAVHATLDRLAERELVARLERRPGQKEERYSQLLEDRETAADALASGGPAPMAAGGTAPAGGFADSDAGDSRARGADGWRAPDGEQQPSSAGATTLSPGAARSPAPAATGSPELLASLAGLQERLARLEVEVAELRTALASHAGEAKAPASPAQVSPEAAVGDEASREWS
jgi:uncharacterized protein YceH (UPF0502 family)